MVPWPWMSQLGVMFQGQGQFEEKKIFCFSHKICQFFYPKLIYNHNGRINGWAWISPHKILMPIKLRFYLNYVTIYFWRWQIYCTLTINSLLVIELIGGYWIEHILEYKSSGHIIYNFYYLHNTLSNHIINWILLTVQNIHFIR